MAATAEDIKKITQHANLTDAVIANIGETLALQQALSYVPPYDGKNQDLKTFLQDVEAGEKYCPEGIRPRYYAGVVSKLRDFARDAVSGKTITKIDELKNALKEYFAPRKNYTHYTAEIQGIRMRQNETITEYHGRIKRLMDSARASLKESFADDQVKVMNEMLGGIAVESFKRGLSDEMLYALSVQEPKTLDEAVKITRRIERDMIGAHNRKGHISTAEASTDLPNPRRVHFEIKTGNPPWKSQPKPDDRSNQYSRRETIDSGNPQSNNFRTNDQRYRDPSPYRNRGDQNELKNRGTSPFRTQERFRGRDASPYRNYDRDSKTRDASPYRNYGQDFRARDPSPYRNYGNNSGGRDASPYRNYEQPRNPPRSQTTLDSRYPPRESYYTTPPTPHLPYPFLPTYPIMPPFPYQYPNPQYVTRPMTQNQTNSTHLNSRSAHPTDATVRENNQQRQTNVKFITAEDLSNQTQTENQHP